jgi:hypothetical protein
LAKRRTHPSYLSNDEAARERRRTEAMVRGIVEHRYPRTTVEINPVAIAAKWSGTTRLGETGRFILDFEGDERLVIIRGMEIPSESLFKLSLTLSQAIAIRELLKKAMNVLWSTRWVKIGEKNGVIVAYDGRLFMMYEKEVRTECPFKLAFDKTELMQMISLLEKAYNFF